MQCPDFQFDRGKVFSKSSALLPAAYQEIQGNAAYTVLTVHISQRCLFAGRICTRLTNAANKILELQGTDPKMSCEMVGEVSICQIERTYFVPLFILQLQELGQTLWYVHDGRSPFYFQSGFRMYLVIWQSRGRSKRGQSIEDISRSQNVALAQMGMK